MRKKQDDLKFSPNTLTADMKEMTLTEVRGNFTDDGVKSVNSGFRPFCREDSSNENRCLKICLYTVSPHYVTIYVHSTPLCTTTYQCFSLYPITYATSRFLQCQFTHLFCTALYVPVLDLDLQDVRLLSILSIYDYGHCNPYHKIFPTVCFCLSY